MEDLKTMSGLGATERQNIETAAVWARFIAIVQFVMLGLGAAGMLFMVLAMRVAGVAMPGMTSAMAGMTLCILIFALIVILASFVPAIYMFRAAQKALLAVKSEDAAALSESLVNLKRLCKFQGILLVVVIALYLLMLIGMFAVGMTAGLA